MEEIHSDVQPPDAMLWSPDQVADWVEQIGYPQYRVGVFRHIQGTKGEVG